MSARASYFKLVFSAAVAIAVPAISGCSADSDGQGQGSGQPSTEIAAQPLSGTVGGRAFEPKTVDIRYLASAGKWLLSIDNYETDCGVRSSELDYASAISINIGGIPAQSGTTSIAYGDQHAATFQIGVYEASSGTEPDVRPAESGVLRIDTWSDTPGGEITGALKLSGEDSAVEGTFTAKVCEPR
jgi:hypothetical protein